MESTVVQRSVCPSVRPSLQPSTVNGMTLGPRVRRAVPPAPVRGRWYPISRQLWRPAVTPQTSYCTTPRHWGSGLIRGSPAALGQRADQRVSRDTATGAGRLPCRAGSSFVFPRHSAALAWRLPPRCRPGGGAFLCVFIRFWRAGVGWFLAVGGRPTTGVDAAPSRTGRAGRQARYGLPQPLFSRQGVVVRQPPSAGRGCRSRSRRRPRP